AWTQVHGRLPFTIVWLCEGAEEIGSKGLPELIADHRDELEADACLWESYLRRSDGTPEIGVGCRGLLYIELELRALAGDEHASLRSVYRSAATELSKAIASITDDSGKVLIDGFRDDITPPDAASLEAATRGAPPDDVPTRSGATSYVVN